MAYFGNGRRMPHGVPLPGHAAPLHGAADGGSLPDHRHPPADAARSRTGCQWAMFLRNHDELTLEMVTDEDRDYMYRVYASDPQARINLGIRRRLAPLMGNNRRRIELMNAAAVLAAGHADHLLRRRDRNGRQHLPRRPQRGAHPDAVEPRPERRVLDRQSAAALLPGDHRPGVPLRGAQRRGAAEQPALAALVDEAPGRAAQAVPGLRPRHAAVPHPGESRACSPSCASGRTSGSSSSPTSPASPRRWSSTCPSSRAPCRWRCSAARTFPRIGDCALLRHAGPARVLLVPAAARVARGARARGRPGAAPAVVFSGTVAGAGDGRGPGAAGGGAAGLSSAARAGSAARRGSIAARVGRAGDSGAGGRPGGARHAGRGPLSRRRRRRRTCCRSRSPRATGCGSSRPTPPAPSSSWRSRGAACSTTPRATRSSSTPCRRRGPPAALAGGRASSWVAHAALAGRSRGSRRRSAPPCFAAEQTNTSVNLGDRLLFKLFRKVEPGINPDLEIGRYLTDYTDFRQVPLLAGGLELRVRGREPDHARRVAPVRAERGGRLELDAQRPEPVLRARGGHRRRSPTEADCGPRTR